MPDYKPIPPGWRIFTSDDYRTPIDWLMPVFDVFGDVDLDPCANPLEHLQYGKRNWTEGGTDRPWNGRTFYNNPYSQGAKWIRHAARQECPRIGLFPPAPGTKFWHDSIWGRSGKDPRAASAVCFVEGRVPFLAPKGRIQIAKREWAYAPEAEWEPEGQNRYESVFVLGDPNREYVSAFADVFSKLGHIIIL